MKIVIVGPAYPFRGGIAAFNERLSRQWMDEGHEVHLVTFTLQYPSFLFPGKTQFSEGPAPGNLDIVRKLSSVNPVSWFNTARYINGLHPDKVVFAYWMSYMSPCMGVVARLVKAPTVGLVHNFLPHERKPWDKSFATFFARSVDSFASLSKSVRDDILACVPDKPCRFNPHPLYDNFGKLAGRQESCSYLGLNPSRKHFLFFGLIRDYKGLDILLESFAPLKDRAELIVAGEFYEDGERYHGIARTLGIDKDVIWHSKFIPDVEVRYYFGAADLVVQPYKTATQSGVTQIAYHFSKPMLVTDVGGLPEIVPDGKVGYVTSPDVEGVRKGMTAFLDANPDFSKGIEDEKKRYSWAKMSEAVLGE